MKNDQIIIERNVPIPKREFSGKWQRLMDPMDAGDSVLLPAKQGASFAASLSKSKFKAYQRRDGDMMRVWKGEKR